MGIDTTLLKAFAKQGFKALITILLLTGLGVFTNWILLAFLTPELKTLFDASGARGGHGGGVANRLVSGKTATQTLELTSDRHQKESFQPTSAKEIAAKVAAMDIPTWAYTNSSNVRHLGPMAQDFKAAFDLGEDDKHIGAGDGIGVALAAIKGLHQMLQEKDSTIATLRGQLSATQNELEGLRTSLNDRLSALEKSVPHANSLQAASR